MGGEVLSSRAVLAALLNKLESSPTGWTSLVGMHFTSDQPIEEYDWLGASPAMQEWRGDRQAAELRDFGLQIRNVPYETGLRVKRRDMRRDKFGQILMRINQLAQRASSHWATLITSLLANGTVGLAYDGVPFFSASHVSGDSGTLSNLITNSDYGALNVADPTLPTAAEMALIIVAGRTHFATLKDDQGEPINESASRYLVMVPPKMVGVAEVAISANLLANGASPAIQNPAMSQSARFEVVENARLTAASQMYMFRTDAEDKSFILQEEEKLRVNAKAEGSEYEYDTDQHEYGVNATRAAGYGIWQYALHMTLS